MQTKTEAIEERIREAATRFRGRAPQLKTIAKYINESDTDYTALVDEEGVAPPRFDRSGRLQRFSSPSRSERVVNVLRVYKGHGPSLVKVYEHNPSETLYTGTDVCRGVVHNVMSEDES